MEHSTEQETWRPVPIGGCSHRYECSSLGRIRSRITNRILRPAENSSGYLTVSLSEEAVPKRQRSFTVHSIVCRAFNGEPLKGQQVDHVNGNKRDNRPQNLEWVTSGENNRRAIRAGLARTCSGSGHANAKLTDQQVAAIRGEPEKRGVKARLARKYNVSEGTIRSIRANRTYRNVRTS